MEGQDPRPEVTQCSRGRWEQDKRGQGIDSRRNRVGLGLEESVGVFCMGKGVGERNTRERRQEGVDRKMRRDLVSPRILSLRKWSMGKE